MAEDRTADPTPARRGRLPDRLWVPALVAGLLATAFVVALLVRADGDPSLLVHAGPPWTDAAGARSSLTVQAADDAFDGQFFYRLGVDPWSTDRTVEGVTFDLPSLRNARWGYGALAFAASGGDPDLVPWALIALNVVAATALGAVGGGLARSSGRHAAWGAVLLLWPGFAYSLSLDTSELVASAFALGALLALRHHRLAPAVLLFCAAVLTRDTTAAIPFGVAAAGAWTWARARTGSGSLSGSGSGSGSGWGSSAGLPTDGVDTAAVTGLTPGDGPGMGASTAPGVSEAAADRDAGAGARARAVGVNGPASIDDTGPGLGSSGELGVDDAGARAADPGGADLDGRPAGRGSAPTAAVGARQVVAGVVPLAAFGVWQLLQRARFGSLPLTSSGDNNLSAPLAGLVDLLREVLPPGGGDEAFRLVSVVGLLGLLALAAVNWRSSSASFAERVAWLPAVAVVVLLNAYLWSGATAFMRATTEAGVLSVVVILGAADRRVLPLATAGLGGLWLLTAAAQLSKLG